MTVHIFDHPYNFLHRRPLIGDRRNARHCDLQQLNHFFFDVVESHQFGVENLRRPFLPDDGLDPAWEVDSVFAEGLLVWGFAGQELEEEDAVAVDVGFEGDFSSFENLRCSVAGNAIGRSGGAEEWVEAEIGNAGVVVWSEKDVGGFNVAVNYFSGEVEMGYSSAGA